jgi:hypothetical protein
MLPVNDGRDRNTPFGELGVGNKYIALTPVMVSKCRSCEPRSTKRNDAGNHGAEEIEDSKCSLGMGVAPEGT